MKRFAAVLSAAALCLASCAGGNSNIDIPFPDVSRPASSQPTAETSTSPAADALIQPQPTALLSTEPSDPPDGVDLTAFGEILLDRYSFGITTANRDTGEVRTSLMVLDPNNEDDRQVIDNYYDGLTDLPLRQCFVCINNFTTVEAELALVQTDSLEDVTAVEEIFQARIDYMVGDGSGPGGAWYPQPTEIWKNNSRIVSNGTYVMFAVHPTEYDEIVDDFSALFGS